MELLKESKRSSEFLMETQIIENALRNPEVKIKKNKKEYTKMQKSTKKNLACYVMNLDSVDISLSSDIFDTVIREACQSLIQTHFKFIPYITRALIHLLHVAKQNFEEVKRNKCIFSKKITHLERIDV